MDARQLVGEREDRPEPEPEPESESDPNPNQAPNLDGCRRCDGPCASLEPNGRAAKVRRCEGGTSSVERRLRDAGVSSRTSPAGAEAGKHPCAVRRAGGFAALLLDW